MRNLYVIIAIFLLVPVFYVGADGLSLASARWGTPTEISSGDAGSITPLTVFLMNSGNGNIAVINATLYMQEPLSSPQGDRYEVVYPKVQIQNNQLKPGDVIPVTFTVNIPSYAAGIYNFSLVVHYNITTTSTAPPVYVQTGSTVLYSPSTTVTTSSLEKASFRFSLPVSQKPSIKVDRIWTVLEENSAAELNFIITNSGDREIKLQSATVSGDIVQVLNPTIYINEWLQPGSYYRLKTRVNVPKGASSNGYALVTVTVSYQLGSAILQKSEVFRFDIDSSGSLGPEIVISTNKTSLMPGREQEVPIEVRNVGDQTANRVEITFQQGQGITIIGPSSMYIGDMRKGDETLISLKVLPSTAADYYVLPAVVTYMRWYQGDYVSLQKQLSLGFSSIQRAEVIIASAQATQSGGSVRITGVLANTGNRDASNVNITAFGFVEGAGMNISRRNATVMRNVTRFSGICRATSYIGSIKQGDTSSFYLSCNIGNATLSFLNLTVNYEASPGSYGRYSTIIPVFKTFTGEVQTARTAQGGISYVYALLLIIASLLVGFILGRGIHRGRKI
jgi:hypothetical protein